MRTVALFAGPGGTCLGAHSLGLSPLGIEWDDAACATRKAAGLPTLQADVGKLDPADFAPLAGLIATPPCQAFSMAGKGKGRDHLPEIVDNWTAPEGVKAPDGRRYAACGDGVVSNVAEWLGRRVLAVNTELSVPLRGVA